MSTQQVCNAFSQEHLIAHYCHQGKMWGVVVELRLNRINARFVRFTITQDLAVTNTVISRHLQTLHVGASRAIKQADATVVCICGKYLKTNM